MLWSWKFRWGLSRLAVLLALLSLGLGCGPADPELLPPDFVLPTFPPPTPTIDTTHPLVQPFAGRLVLPTLTPAPTETPWPTRTPTPAVTPTPEGLLGYYPVVVELLSCREHYQFLVETYPTFQPFDALVANQLNETLLELRSDCGADAADWQPEFTVDISCEWGYVDYPENRMRISEELSGYNSDQIPKPVAGVAGRDSAGDVLIHFQRMPAAGYSGCWYYSAYSREWQWRWNDYGLARPPRNYRAGVFYPNFHSCEGRLRDVLALGGRFFDGELGILRATNRVKLELPDACGELWELQVDDATAAACGEGRVTGPFAEDKYQVNWAEGYRPGGQTHLCWVFDGEWTLFRIPEDLS